jgi:hypothetical protein
MQVVVISPFSNRGWIAEDQSRLTSIARPLISILYRLMQITRLQDELLTAQQDLQEAQVLQRQAEESSRGLMEMVSLLQKQMDPQPVQVESKSG